VGLDGCMEGVRFAWGVGTSPTEPAFEHARAGRVCKGGL
jgi:hypothetical protein